MVAGKRSCQVLRTQYPVQGTWDQLGSAWTHRPLSHFHWSRYAVLAADSAGNHSMKLACLPRLLCCGALVAVSAGCPSSTPPAPVGGAGGANSGGSASTAAAAQPDSAADVKALEDAGAILGRDAAGNVIAVEVDHDTGNDEQIARLKGLPNLITLDAGASGVTDKGLASLKGHPSLRVLKL